MNNLMDEKIEICELFDLDINEVLKLSNKIAIFPNLIELEKGIKGNDFVRDKFLNYVFINKDSLKNKLRKHLEKGLRIHKTFDAHLDVFCTRLLEYCNSAEMFEDVLFMTADDYVLLRFLGAIFISNNDINELVINAENLLVSEKEYFSDEDYYSLLKTEIVESLKRYDEFIWERKDYSYV